MSERYIAIQVVMMPSDTNPHGTIFGGVILSYIDMAGAIAARRQSIAFGNSPEIAFVTVAFNRVEFKEPVYVGDVMRFETWITRVGKTSITVHIDVIAERTGKEIHVTEAEVVYVGIDSERHPMKINPQS
ncbi:MAG: hotdog domain-containing protein [Zavarzinella sp.]